MTTTRGTTQTPVRLVAARRFLSALRLGPSDLDRAAILAAAVLDAPVASVTVLTDRPILVGAHGAAPEADLGDGFSPLVVEGGVHAVEDALAAEDATTVARVGPRVPGSEPLRSYLGVALVDAHAERVGVLAVADRRVRRWSARDRDVLAALATWTVSEVVVGRAAFRRDRLLEAVESAPVAIAVVGGADRSLEYLNPTFAELFVLPPEDRGHRGGVVPARSVADLGLEEMTARVDEVIATGRAIREDEQRTAHPDREATVSYSPIVAEPDGPHDVLVVGVDVSAQVRNRRTVARRADEAQLLARASAALQSAVEPVAELEALAASLVPQFADACSAILLDRPVPVGTVGVEVAGRRVAFAVAPDLAAEPPGLDPALSWGGSGLLAEVVRTGRPMTEQVAGRTAEAARGAGSLPWLEAVDAATLAATPVRVAGDVVGILVFASRRSRGPLTRADLSVLERIAARADAALGQGLTYVRQRDTSLALQRSMLPDAPTVPGLRVVTRYRPTALDSEVGGDWYDAFALPGGDLAIAIGDVAGHDLAAAATMGQLRSMLRALVYDRDDESPGELLERLDRAATGLRVTDFTSAVLARLHLDADGPPTLRWSNAGHPPPLLLHADGRAELLEAGAGMVMGVLPDRSRPTGEVELAAGSTLLLYTDGLVERRGRDPDENVLTLVERATRALDTVGTDPAFLDDLCDRLVADAPVADDVAVVAVCLDRSPRRPGPSGPAVSEPRG